MAQFQVIWIPPKVAGFGTFTEIPSTFTGPFGSLSIRGETLLLFGNRFAESIGSWQSLSCFAGITPEPPPTPPPPPIDPPFPPVFPYFFSTDLVYGRDNLNAALTMVRGDTYKFSGRVILNGVPVNLTDCVLRMTAKYKATDPENQAVFSLSTANPLEILVTSAVNGEFSVTIASNRTSGLPGFTTRLYYDIQLTDATGAIFTVLRGTLTVIPDITTVV